MKREEELEDYSLPFRHALMKGVGLTKRQLQKPLIGVLNSWGEINPAAGHLDRLTKMVKAGIESAGGTPMEFAISSLCGGMAGGGRGSSYSLAYRDVVADLVELFAEENFFDGIVFTSVCDDVVPAHLMAAARLNLPSILLWVDIWKRRHIKERFDMSSRWGQGRRSKKGRCLKKNLMSWQRCPVEIGGLSYHGNRKYDGSHCGNPWNDPHGKCHGLWF
jgi:dihydroxyacid dehydratase/phosphogluconate dehydratase